MSFGGLCFGGKVFGGDLLFICCCGSDGDISFTTGVILYALVVGEPSIKSMKIEKPQKKL